MNRNRAVNRNTAMLTKMAAEYRGQGMAHPEAAAAAMACRGRVGLTQPQFANRLGLAPASVQSLESGEQPAEILLSTYGDAVPEDVADWL